MFIPIYFTNNPSMLKWLELINSEKENIVRNLSVTIYKAFCFRNSTMYSDKSNMVFLKYVLL